MSPFHRHLWYIKPRPVTLYLGCAIGEDADRDPFITVRLASCLWTNHRLDICPSEKWGEPRVALSLRHHVNVMPRVPLVAGPLRSGTRHTTRFRIARRFHPLSGSF